jgi:hypothetical protein
MGANFIQHNIKFLTTECEPHVPNTDRHGFISNRRKRRTQRAAWGKKMEDGGSRKAQKEKFNTQGAKKFSGIRSNALVISVV